MIHGLFRVLCRAQDSVHLDGRFTMPLARFLGLAGFKAFVFE